MSEQRTRLLIAAIISERDPLRTLLTQHRGNILTGFPVNPLPWHFPDGEVRADETLVEAVCRSFKEDLGIAPAEIDRRVCLPTETINPDTGRHIITLHLIVRLPVGAQLVSRSGIGFAWFPMDSYKDPSFKNQVLSSTYEIFRLLNEDI